MRHEAIPITKTRICIAYFCAILIGGSIFWLPAVWELGLNDKTSFGRLLENSAFILAAAMCFGILLSILPYLILLSLGRRFRLLSLPYSLLVGVLLCEWTFQLGIRINRLLGGPDDPFLNGWSTSPKLNGTVLLAGLLGGLVFWSIGLRVPRRKKAEV